MMKAHYIRIIIWCTYLYSYILCSMRSFLFNARGDEKQHVYFYVNFGILTRWLNVANHNHRFEMINLSCNKIMNDDLSRTMITFCVVILIGCQTGDVALLASGFWQSINFSHFKDCVGNSNWDMIGFL